MPDGLASVIEARFPQVAIALDDLKTSSGSQDPRFKSVSFMNLATAASQGTPIPPDYARYPSLQQFYQRVRGLFP